jgi:hypothetical protein
MGPLPNWPANYNAVPTQILSKRCADTLVESEYLPVV